MWQLIFTTGGEPKDERVALVLCMLRGTEQFCCCKKESRVRPVEWVAMSGDPRGWSQYLSSVPHVARAQAEGGRLLLAGVKSVPRCMCETRVGLADG